MKKIFIVIFLLCSFLQHGISQPYLPMIKEAAHWKTESQVCASFFGCDPSYPVTFIYTTSFYKLQGDTLIGTVLYKKLFLSTDQTCPQCPPGFPIGGCTPYSLLGYMVEDTSARKVYFKPVSPGCTDDTLFADFSLTAGDTLIKAYESFGNFYNCDTGKFVVDSVGYAQFQNDTYRTWFIRNLTPGYSTRDIMLYEGIGYSYGFRLGYTLGDGAGYAQQLTGYCIDSSCWTSCVPLGIKDDLTDDIIVCVYPNPVGDILYIRAKDVAVLKLQIFDPEGKNVITSSAERINLSSMASGIYTLIVSTDKGLMRKKVTKY